MGSPLSLRTDYGADALSDLAKRCRDTRQARRLLSLAAVYDGMKRTEAARIGGMDRQTLRDWVIRFNDEGPEGLIDRQRHGGISPSTAKSPRSWTPALTSRTERGYDSLTTRRCCHESQQSFQPF